MLLVWPNDRATAHLIVNIKGERQEKEGLAKTSGGLNGGEWRVLIFLRAATKARCFSRFIQGEPEMLGVRIGLLKAFEGIS